MRAFRAPFWRPLLHLSRAQTRDLALRCTPGFVQDPSNERLASPRVRVRAQVLVALRELNPQMDAAFVRVAQQAQEAEDALGQWADRELLGRRIGPGCHDLAGLDQLPIAVALRVVRAMCGHEGIELSALDHETLRKICEAARLRAALAQGRCEAPVGGLGPVRFDLHPFGHLTVRSTKLTVFIAPASRATHGKSSSL